MRQFIDLLDKNRQVWGFAALQPPLFVRLGFAIAWLYRVLIPLREPGKRGSV